MEDRMVKLNVGGTWHTTTASTLQAYETSLLAKLVKDKEPTPEDDGDDNGYYFIDRDGVLFKHILNFLRTSKLIVPSDFTEYDQLLEEAKFYNLKSLEQNLKDKLNKMKDTKFVEVIEISHPEKVGCSSARVILTETLMETPPFCDIIDDDETERYQGRCGRSWIRTKISRLDWAEILTNYGWTLLSTTSFSRRLPDITGQGTDLCHMVDKWCYRG